MGKIKRTVPSKLRGLLIRQPFIDWILDGKKTWEIRGSATAVRGPIALLQSGSGTIVGTCELIDVEGPLTAKKLRANAKRLNEKASELGDDLYYGDHTFAWVLAKARRLKKPVSYDHPPGAVIWVVLDDKIRRKIGL